MPHYHEPIEYDAELDRTIVRGINYSLRPYAIEIRGEGAFVWAEILTSTNYFRRKANGAPEAKNYDPAEFTSREKHLPIIEEGDQEETLSPPLPED